VIEESKSRYVKKCAACGAEFNPADSPSFKRHFPCVHCGVELEYVMRHKLIVSVFSLAVALGLPFILGMGGLTYLLSVILIAPLAWLLTMLIADQIDPPPTQKYSA
jgi:DNA-directed RNA polymerase subunit RPC12/RpoP